MSFNQFYLVLCVADCKSKHCLWIFAMTLICSLRYLYYLALALNWQ